jgi:hypothetical protein
MKLMLFLPLVTLSILTANSRAFAGEALFARTYTVETVPKGHFELEQVVRNRTQRSFGEYNSYDFKNEFEYGFTDNFQGAIYLNSQYLYAKNAPDDNDAEGKTASGFSRDAFFLQSITLEFIYRVLNPITDPVGVAFYFEPEWWFYDIHNGDKTYDSMGNEFRLLIQKNFFEDQLILAYNFIVETEYFRYAGRETQWMGEFDWNNELGVTYRIASNWYAGLEARNHNELGSFYSHDHSVFWAGPVIHYGAEKLWATLGVMKQIYGNPSGFDSVNGWDNGPNGYFLHSHEMWESTFKLGLAF